MNKFDWFYLRNSSDIVVDRIPKLKYSKWVLLTFLGLPALSILYPNSKVLIVLGSSAFSAAASHYLYIMLKYRVIIGKITCWEYDPRSIFSFTLYWFMVSIMGLITGFLNVVGLIALFRYFN